MKRIWDAIDGITSASKRLVLAVLAPLSHTGVNSSELSDPPLHTTVERGALRTSAEASCTEPAAPSTPIDTDTEAAPVVGHAGDDDRVHCVSLNQVKYRELEQQEGDASKWTEDGLVEFMFAQCSTPTQRKAWELRRPLLQQLLHELLDGLVGGAGVVDLIESYTEPAPAELSLAWAPHMIPADEQSADLCEWDIRDTRYGGLPYLREGEEWPAALDERASNFVLQLRLSQLPAGLAAVHAAPGRPASDQLVQVFGGDCSFYDGKTITRLVDCSAPARSDVASPAEADVYQEQCLAGWETPVRDYPSSTEWEYSNVRVPDTAPMSVWYDKLFRCRVGDQGTVTPRDEDKVGGWGVMDGCRAIQAECDICGMTMEPLMQVNSGSIGFDV